MRKTPDTGCSPGVDTPSLAIQFFYLALNFDKFSDKWLWTGKAGGRHRCHPVTLPQIIREHRKINLLPSREKYKKSLCASGMSQSSLVFKFATTAFTSASKEFPKSNVEEIDGSKWYLGVEKSETIIKRKVFDIFLTCERGTMNGIYLVNTALILRGTLIDLLFTRTYNFEPLDLEMSCFKIDVSYVLDKDNGFTNEEGECEIMAEISVCRIDSDEQAFKEPKNSSPNELDGIINLQGGPRVRINKELLSRHSKYFDNIFNNEHFEESSQEAIDLPDFTYKQFRLLYKHIYESRNLYSDGNVEFRLKSENGVKDFQKLWNLSDIRKYYDHLKLSICSRSVLEQAKDDSSEKSSKLTLCMFDDVKQMGALVGLICCVTTEYASSENKIVSTENVEDLLLVGSYFQISTILDSCKKFLCNGYAHSGILARRSRQLLDKFNLFLFSSPPIDSDDDDNSIANPTDRSSTEILAHVKFLDTGNEEMCSVERLCFMTNGELLHEAISKLYYKGVIDNLPSDYKTERMHISDPNVSSDIGSQGVDVEDIDSFMSQLVRSSFIYSFEVRLKTREETWSQFYQTSSPICTNIFAQQQHDLQLSLSQTSIPKEKSWILNEKFFTSDNKLLASTIEPSTSKFDNFTRPRAMQSFQRTNNESKSAAPMDYDDDDDSLANPNDISSTEILAHVTFLDTGNEQMCSVHKVDLMTVQRLLHVALATLHFRGFCNQSWNYKVESAQISNPSTHFEISYPIDDEENDSFMSCYARPSLIYSFGVRLKSREDRIETDDHLTSEFQPSTLTETQMISKEMCRTLEEKPFASAVKPSTSELGSRPRLKASKVMLRNAEQSSNVLVYITFLDTGNVEMYTALRHPRMEVQKLFSIALWSIYLRDKENTVSLPSNYELESVRVSNPALSRYQKEVVSLDVNDAMLGYVLDSHIYNFDVRLKSGMTSTSNGQTSKRKALQWKEFTNQDQQKSIASEPKRLKAIPETSQQSANMLTGESCDVQVTNKESIGISVQVTFLDSGEEETCVVLYEDRMSIQDLFSRALKIIFCFSCQYNLESVLECNRDSTSEKEPRTFDIQDIEATTVNSSCGYIFRVQHLITACRSGNDAACNDAGDGQESEGDDSPHHRNGATFLNSHQSRSAI